MFRSLAPSSSQIEPFFRWPSTRHLVLTESSHKEWTVKQAAVQTCAQSEQNSEQTAPTEMIEHLVTSWHLGNIWTSKVRRILVKLKRLAIIIPWNGSHRCCGVFENAHADGCLPKIDERLSSDDLIWWDVDERHRKRCIGITDQIFAIPPYL